ncbi:MAG: hypothetical protein KIS81_08775 [Maricaulaceae bacterium]|nr:hypothetical protein [Maricaulaceae bacterium]
MNLYAYVGNNPLNATDPSGMCEAGTPNCPEPGQRQKEYEESQRQEQNQNPISQVVSAVSDFIANYNTMVEHNFIGADKYYHCAANCEAAQRGEIGESVANVISDAREVSDVMREIIDQTLGRSDNDFSEYIQDAREDLEANEFGRAAPHQPGFQSCRVSCMHYWPSPQHNPRTPNESRRY